MMGFGTLYTRETEVPWQLLADLRRRPVSITQWWMALQTSLNTSLTVAKPLSVASFDSSLSSLNWELAAPPGWFLHTQEMWLEPESATSGV